VLSCSLTSLFINIHKRPDRRYKNGVSDVTNAINKLKPGKSDGCSGLCSDYFKHAPTVLAVYISLLLSALLTHGTMPQGSPFPQIDIIQAVVIVWRVRGKLSGLFCAILCAAIVHSAMHTHMNRLTVLWIGFCLTGPISLC